MYVRFYVHKYTTPVTESRRKKLGSNSRRERQQSSLPWDPDLEEATDQPPHMILLDPYLVVYRRRRHRLISRE